MNTPEYEGPSSFSTLYFVPDFIKDLLEDDVTINDLLEEKTDHSSARKSNDANYAHSDDEEMPVPVRSTYALRSRQKAKAKATAPSITLQKPVSDYETMAFVGLRDIIKISHEQLAKLYKWNKREYETFQAAVANNQHVDYNALINRHEFSILYHFFCRVNGLDAWTEICDELGFTKFFPLRTVQQLFQHIQARHIRAKDGQYHLRFFMRLVIFYWDSVAHFDVDSSSNSSVTAFGHFWLKALSKTIRFISELAVGRNIEIYCLLSKQWVNATIVQINANNHQLCAQYLNGQRQHQWLSYYSPQIAPIRFRFGYTPNTSKRNNVPCIVAVVDKELDDLAVQHLPARDQFAARGDAQGFTTNQRVQSAKNVNGGMGAIPTDKWYYESDQGGEVGPVSIAQLFIACVEKNINQFTPVRHAMFGTTTLQKLPHVTNAFRTHVQKCKRLIDAQQVPATVAPVSSVSHGQPVIITKPSFPPLSTISNHSRFPAVSASSNSGRMTMQSNTNSNRDARLYCDGNFQHFGHNLQRR